MLAGILIGATAALAVAVLCALCYTQGTKHAEKRIDHSAAAGEEQNALMKKYEAIMGYDPYGEGV